MRKIKMIFLVLVAILLASGCDLEEKIYDTATADLFIQKESDIQGVLNGIYSTLQSFSCFKSNFNYTLMYSTEDLAATNTTFRLYKERTVPATNIYHAYAWAGFFTAINSTNSLIESLNKLEWIEEDYKTRILGECHFLRAFSYFYLVRMFGGIPLKTEATGGDSDFYMARNSVEEVYSQILADFKVAAEDCIVLSEQPADEKGHATKGSAQAMLSLANLTYANQIDLGNQSGNAAEYYQLAENYADSVILSNEYTLVNDFADLFDVSQEATAYNESVFYIQFTRDATKNGAGSKGSEWAYYFQSSYRYYITGSPSTGRGVSSIFVSPWFYDYYNTGEYENDYRSEVSFITRFKFRDYSPDRYVITYPETKTASNDIVQSFPYVDKYKDPNGYDARNNENDLHIIRLSEVYLIKAEAENELNGPTAVAYAAFNKVRERARNADDAVRTTPANLEAGLSKEEFRVKIFDERGIEFFAEEHRWFDEIRMRYKDNTRTMVQYLYEDYLPSLVQASPKYNYTTNTWEGGTVQPLNVVSWTPRFLLWPIPSIEFDANPNMTQNSEYGW